MARFDLTDAEWTIIAPLLPGAEGRKNGRPRPDDRKVINGIFFVLRTGTPCVICRSGMGPTRPCTTGSIVGRRQASGFEYLRRWRRDRCSRCN
jgi:transposase